MYTYILYVCMCTYVQHIICMYVYVCTHTYYMLCTYVHTYYMQHVMMRVRRMPW